MFVKLKNGKTLNLADASWIGATPDCQVVAAFSSGTETLMFFPVNTDGIVRSVLAAKAIRDARDQGCLAFNLHQDLLDSDLPAAASDFLSTLNSLGDVISDRTAFDKAIAAIKKISSEGSV